MKQMVEFFPNNEFFKKPIGAIKADNEVFFRIKFLRPQNPEDVFLCLTKDGESEVRYLLAHEKTEVDGTYIFSGSINVTSKGLYFYHFLICTPTECIPVGSDDDLNAMLGKGQDWQLTVYECESGGADWFKGGVIYQIMPDRFNIGGDRLKTKTHAVYRDDWGGVPEFRPNKNGKILNNDFFGGNLKGITKKLGYIKSLGVNCIYLNPIFEARSNHKYDTGNYRKIDSDFGTEEDFNELIKKAAKKGIRIILDGVFSHTGDDSIYFNKYSTYDSVGAYQSKDSPYAEFYSFSDFEKREYECWWNIDTLPNTVEENVRFDEFINGEDGIVSYWTNKGIGGWRLDVVDELPDKFLERVTRRVKKIDPTALVLGEVWEDASNKISYSKRRKYLQGGQLDSVTNYPFKADILHFVRTGDEKKLLRTIEVLKNNYPKSVLDSVMNLLSTHDTVRILTELGTHTDTSTREKRAKARVENLDEAVNLLKMATLLQFTLPGVPCIYYGDETGLEGFEDPFNRRCMDFDNKNRVINRWYKRLGAIRQNEREIFASGEYYPLALAKGVMSFVRKMNGSELTIIVNNSGKDFVFAHDDVDYIDLLTNKPFKGKVLNKSGACLKKAEAL